MLSGRCGAPFAPVNSAGTSFGGSNLSVRLLADFICLEARLVVEVDGGHHDDEQQRAHDQNRSD